MSASSPSLHTEQLRSLVARWRAGDKVAADELLRRSTRRLEALARRALQRYPDAYALADTNDVLLSVFKRLETAIQKITPTNTQHYFALASQHIRWCLLELTRTLRKRMPQLPDKYPDPVALGTSADEIRDLEWWESFHEAVENLPPDERSAFSVYFYGDLTLPEVAEALGVCDKTVSRRINSAKIELRELLGDWLPGVELEANADEQDA